MLLSCDWSETVPLHPQRTVSQFKTRPDAQRKRAGRKAHLALFAQLVVRAVLLLAPSAAVSGAPEGGLGWGF
jgi:hypothetical protein